MALANIREGYKTLAWFNANPTLVLLQGQRVNLDTQLGVYKLGDGTTQLSVLTWLGDISGKENASNKATDWTVINDTLYPTVKNVDTRINGVITASLSFFYYKTISDIGTYYKMLQAPSTGGAQSIVKTNTTGTTSIAKFITEPSLPNKLYIPIGWNRIHVHSEKLGAGNVTLFAKIFKRDLGGTETVLFTTAATLTNLTTSNLPYDLEYYNTGIVQILATDRIGVEILSVTATGTPDVTIWIEDAFLSRVDLPSASNDLSGYEPLITATTSADFFSGAKTFINFATTVRATVLTGLSLVSSTVISATDSVLVALGSLQAQVTLRELLSNKDATGGYAGLTLFKINFKNVANTFTSFFTNSNTASRTYTFQDRNGTIADDTDLAGKQATLVSLTNIRTVNGSTLLGSTDLAVGTILGSVGATATLGTPLPYNSGVANTLTSSPFISVYNSGSQTYLILTNTSTSQQEAYFLEENGQYSSLKRYGSAFVASNFSGTSFPKSNVLTLESGNNLTYPIVLLGSPIINGIGTTSTNVATRHDATGWRQGTMADVHTANTVAFEVAGVAQFNNVTRLMTYSNASPNEGDIWKTATDFNFQRNTITEQVASKNDALLYAMSF